MIARDYPTAMLRLRESYWRCGPGDTNADELAQEWLETPNGESVPLHPRLQELPHDVFTSSATALKLMLQSDSLVEIQFPNARADQWSPFGETAMASNEQQDTEAPKRLSLSDESKEQKPSHQFFLRGDIYYIRYTEDDVVEEAEIKHSVNIETCYRIVLNAHKSLSPAQALGLKDDIIRTNAIPEESTYASMPLDEVQASIDAFIQLIEDLKKSGDEDNQLEGITQLLDEAQHWQKARKAGRARKRLPAGDHIKKSVAAVNKQRDRFKQELVAKKMPRFAAHMMRCLDATGGTYRYTPPEGVEWVLNDLG